MERTFFIEGVDTSPLLATFPSMPACLMYNGNWVLRG
jgi:hypothetical protein